MVIRVNLVPKVQMALQDQLGLKVTQGKMEVTASQALMVLLEIKEKKDIQAQMDIQAHKDQMEKKEKKVMMDQMVQLDLKDPKVPQDPPTHHQVLQVMDLQVTLLLHHQKTFMIFFLNHICFEEMIQ